jgi:hypothetical protein
VPLAVLNSLAFLIDGFIIGMKSAGRTILEPGIPRRSRWFWRCGQFQRRHNAGRWRVPFVAGVIGGWLGERRQEMA